MLRHVALQRRISIAGDYNFKVELKLHFPADVIFSTSQQIILRAKDE